MGFFNAREFSPLLPLLPRPLINKTRLTKLFQAIIDYADNTDADPMYRRDFASQTCDEFEREAVEFGTTDADQLLGGLARQLKTAVTSHFDALEASKIPSLTFSPIAKKISTENIRFKNRVQNQNQKRRYRAC